MPHSIGWFSQSLHVIHLVYLQTNIPRKPHFPIRNEHSCCVQPLQPNFCNILDHFLFKWIHWKTFMSSWKKSLFYPFRLLQVMQVDGKIERIFLIKIPHELFLFHWTPFPFFSSFLQSHFFHLLLKAGDFVILWGLCSVIGILRDNQMSFWLTEILKRWYLHVAQPWQPHKHN